jgi:hypothetical protein
VLQCIELRVLLAGRGVRCGGMLGIPAPGGERLGRTLGRFAQWYGSSWGRVWGQRAKGFLRGRTFHTSRLPQRRGVVKRHCVHPSADGPSPGRLQLTRGLNFLGRTRGRSASFARFKSKSSESKCPPIHSSRRSSSSHCGSRMACRNLAYPQ